MIFPTVCLESPGKILAYNNKSLKRAIFCQNGTFDVQGLSTMCVYTCRPFQPSIVPTSLICDTNIYKAGIIPSKFPPQKELKNLSTPKQIAFTPSSTAIAYSDSLVETQTQQ
mmetsp:Transcript_11422/g.19210  ORF Transcript_11422/g.19210 Transcript_11422/m.19210 type:complete len:112 (+) Transcript_11422:53-388(+)